MTDILKRRWFLCNWNRGKTCLWRITNMSNKDTAKKYFEEGMADFLANNYGKSIYALSRAIQIDPNSRISYMSRGSAYLKLDKIGDAIADFNKAIEINIEYARAYHLRGLAHEKTGDNQNALEDFDKAIELNPDYGAAYHSRATLYSKIGKEDLAAKDIEMLTRLTEVNIETFANENNVWRSRQLQLESMDVADPMDR